MPAKIANADKMLLDTDYPLDIVIYMVSGSFAVPGGGGVGAEHSIAHSLGFIPLMTGNWSLTSDFSSTKEFFIPVYSAIDGIYARVSSTMTATKVSAINYTASEVTVYYRIYGFLPADDGVETEPTSIDADDFVINTDYNYTKLYYSGKTESGTTTTITHNFGYRPQVKAWYDGGSSIAEIQADYSPYVTVTDTTVVAVPGSGRIHLRIYADKQV